MKRTTISRALRERHGSKPWLSLRRTSWPASSAPALLLSKSSKREPWTFAVESLLYGQQTFLEPGIMPEKKTKPVNILETIENGSD
jgi:hypothetical protein